MAKVKGGSGSTRKINFGKRKKGKSRKSFNKHDKTNRIYRGQGR